MRAPRGVYVHYTEKQCRAALTLMLGVIRRIVCPEKTNKAFVAEATGAGTCFSRSGMQIRNIYSYRPRINNPINNLIGKLDGTRKLRNAIADASYAKKLWNTITNARPRRRRDADSRARLRTLNIIL